MKYIKNRDLKKCMKKIHNNVNEYSVWGDSDYRIYCSNPENEKCLLILENEGLIKIINNVELNIQAVKLTIEGLTYFSKIQQTRADFLKHFFTQFLTGFLSGVAVSAVVSQIVK